MAHRGLSVADNLLYETLQNRVERHCRDAAAGAVGELRGEGERCAMEIDKVALETAA